MGAAPIAEASTVAPAGTVGTSCGMSMTGDPTNVTGIVDNSTEFKLRCYHSASDWPFGFSPGSAWTGQVMNWSIWTGSSWSTARNCTVASGAVFKDHSIDATLPAGFVTLTWKCSAHNDFIGTTVPRSQMAILVNSTTASDCTTGRVGVQCTGG